MGCGSVSVSPAGPVSIIFIYNVAPETCKNYFKGTPLQSGHVTQEMSKFLKTFFLVTNVWGHQNLSCSTLMSAIDWQFI